MDYFNQKEVHLMVWEENPNKRNINNEIKVNVKKSIELSIGDRICTGTPQVLVGTYTIEEITDSKQSSLTEYNYVTAKIKYTRHN